MRCASAAPARLLVTPAPLVVADGWREGWCATAVDDGWAAIDVSGADAPLALAQGTSADLAGGLALGRRRLLWAALPIGADGGGLPAARRGAVARDAPDLARRRLTAGSTYVLRIVVSPPNISHVQPNSAKENQRKSGPQRFEFFVAEVNLSLLHVSRFSRRGDIYQSAAAGASGCYAHQAASCQRRRLGDR